MAKSNIEWTDYTFNPWRGCTKISDGCKFCYADTLSRRSPTTLGVWGKNGSRPIAAESYWKQPVTWNSYAREGVCPECKGKGILNLKQEGERLCDNCALGLVSHYRPNVFCGSLMDVFEGNDSMPESSIDDVQAARDRLFKLIIDTPNLNWLLLTKRPENVEAVLKRSFPSPYGLDLSGGNKFIDAWMDRVWLGTSIEDQKTADERIPQLLNTNAAVRFLSIEPLLGEIEFSNVSKRSDWKDQLGKKALSGIDWVIVGGESGTNARPMHPDWVRSIRDQCVDAGVPFFFKQWGEWLRPSQMPDATYREIEDFGDGIGIGDYPLRVGKKKAGRQLDGREWSEFPEVKNA